MRLRFAVLFSLVLLLAGCTTDDPTRSNSFIPLTSISVSGTYEEMANKTINQYTAVGDFSGQFTRDITAEVSWRIANRKIASVSNSGGSEGLVTAKSPGETMLEASLEGVTGSAPVTVSDAELTALEISPQDAELNTGLTKQYTATGTFSDNSTQDITILASWDSSDTAVATIDTAGLATTVDVGTTTISAGWQGIASSTDLLVTAATLTVITVIPEQATIAQGTTVQFEAEGEFSDGSVLDVTDVVDWQSDDQGIGVVIADGLVEGVAAGTTDISASFETAADTIEDTAELIVTDAVIESIVITPEDSTIEEGENQQFIATGTFSDDTEQDITELTTWLTTDNSVGTISNTSGSRGLFTSTDTGSTTIEASFGGVTGGTAITVE
jgi:hypothetical protein